MNDEDDGIEIECPTCGALCTTDSETGDHEPVYRDDDDIAKLRAENEALRSRLSACGRHVQAAVDGVIDRGVALVRIANVIAGVTPSEGDPR